MRKKGLKNQLLSIFIILSLILSPFMAYAASENSDSNLMQQQEIVDFIDKVGAAANVTIGDKVGIKIIVKLNYPQGGGNNKNATLFLTKQSTHLLGVKGFQTKENTVIEWLEEAFKNQGQAKKTLQEYGFVKDTGSKAGGNTFVYTVLASETPKDDLEQQYPTIHMETINRHNQVVNEYYIPFDAHTTQQKQILPTPIILDTGAKIAVTIEGKNLDKQQYQIIKSENEPLFPGEEDSKWESLGDIPRVLPNTKEAYPDLIDRPGYISTRHYQYNFDSKKYPAGTTPPRHETFGFPTGENLVKQRAVIDPNNRYHSQEEENAFFGNSEISKTGGQNKAVKFWGYIIPDVTGDYNLGAYSDDGAYGYVIIGNEKKVFVEDWRVKAAYNRTGTNETGSDTPLLKLEKDKVYPIYMEWYEGCPTHKAFIPRYTVAGEKSWRNIPNSWFYASSNTTPGDVNEAYFDAYTLENQIPLPTEPSTYYAALQIASQDGVVRQVLNGPFKIQSIVPHIISNFNSKNFILPEGLSNISYNVSFQVYSKAIKYEVDLKDIKYKVDLKDIEQKQLDGGELIKFVLDNAIVTLSANGSIVKLEEGAHYTISIDDNELKLIITLNETFNATAGSTQLFDIYIPTRMGSGIAYGNTENSYLHQYANKKTAPVQVTVTATPRIQEAFIKEDGTEQEAQYGSPETQIKEVELKYVPMPKIN